MGAVYQVLVDWNDDGSFAGAYDALPVLNRDGVSIDAGRDQPRKLSPTRPGDAGWTADNSDRRFSDPAAALGSDLSLYRAVKVQASIDGGAWVDLFTGRLDGWNVSLDNYPLIAASFDAVDGLARLADTTVYTALYNGLRTDQAIGKVLDAAGWPAGARRLDAGLTVLGYWCAEGDSALSVLQSLADHEQGFVYVDAAGVFVFEYRYNRVDRGGAATATFDEAVNVSGVKWRTSAKDVYNRVTVTVEPRTQDGALSAVWQLGATLALGPNEAIRLYCTGEDPFTGAVVPVAGTDYTVTAGALAALTLAQTSGKTAIMDVTAGAGGATLTGLQVRAYAVKVTKPVSWTFEDVASQAQYGLRSLDLSLPYLQDPNVGRDAAQAILGRYAQPVPAADLTVKAGPLATTEGNLSDAINTRLSDRVAVNLPSIGAVWPGHVEAVSHRISAAMHEVTFSVEQASAEGVATLDDDYYGLLDEEQTRLGW